MIRVGSTRGEDSDRSAFDPRPATHDRLGRGRDGDQPYRLLFDAHPNPMFVFDEETLRFLAVNEAALEAYGGWSREEFLGMALFDIRLPEERPGLREAVARNRGAKAAHIGVFRHVRKDGTERHMEVTASSIVMGGRPARLCSMQDVTERHRAEEALQRYELLAGVTADIVLFIGRDDGRILDANAAAVAAYGYTRDELLRLGIDDLRAPETVEMLPQQMSAADSQGLLFETVHRRKDGSTFAVEVNSVGAAMDGMRTLMSVVRDVSARKRAEEAVRKANEELREADQRKTEFLGVLSHELRNPLAPIRNGIYLLERAAPGSPEAARAREVLRRQTEHLTRLVDDLLDLTRISRGKIALQRTTLDLRDVVRKTADDLHSVFDQAGLSVRVEMTAGPVWIDADPTRMAQVVGNLLQNSAKFTPSGGIVEIGVATRDGRGELRVRDSGVGMEPAVVEHMFEPFAQADRTLARTKGGLGLGLALVRGIVELHGGTVHARSDGLGRGAEFVLRLPIVAAPGAAAAQLAPSVDEHPRVVLLIEDNVDAGLTLADILTLHGHRVTVAPDARSGLELARELRPDVILCDIGLPDADGYHVARALRSDPATGGTRLVALSGYAQREDRQRAREAGFDAHLSKPANIDELMKVLGGDVRS